MAKEQVNRGGCTPRFRAHRPRKLSSWRQQPQLRVQPARRSVPIAQRPNMTRPTPGIRGKGMKRKAATMILLAAISGCVSTESPGPAGPGAYMNHVNHDIASAAPPCGPEGGHCGAELMNGAPGMIGGNGQPVMASARARMPEVTPQSMAFATAAQGLPPGVLQEIAKNDPRGRDLMQVSANMPAGDPMGGVMQAGGPMCGPNGCPPGAPPGAVNAVGALTGGPVAPFLYAAYLESTLCWPQRHEDLFLVWTGRPTANPASAAST